MSALYDIQESSVIDEEMLEKAVEDQTGLIAKGLGLKYDKVTHLRLDYRRKLLTHRPFLLYVLLHISFLTCMMT